MRGLYADVIIDISHEAIDRTFQYAIPDDIAGRIPDARKSGQHSIWQGK